MFDEIGHEKIETLDYVRIGDSFHFFGYGLTRRLSCYRLINLLSKRSDYFVAVIPPGPPAFRPANDAIENPVENLFVCGFYLV